MDEKYCSYCNYFDMDTSRFPIRYTCMLHKARIVKDEQAEQCPDFKRLVSPTKVEVENEIQN